MGDLHDAQEVFTGLSRQLRTWIAIARKGINMSEDADANALMLAIYDSLIRCAQDMDRAMCESRHQAAVEAAVHTAFAGTPQPPVEKKPAKYAEDVDKVIAHYQLKHPQARPGDKEKRLIRDRLKDGFDVAKLKMAIDGCHMRKHNQGDNDSSTKYLSLDLIMRNASKVLMYYETAEERGFNPDSNRTQAIKAFQRLHKFNHRNDRIQAVLNQLPNCERSDPRFGNAFRTAFIDQYERNLNEAQPTKADEC